MSDDNMPALEDDMPALEDTAAPSQPACALLQQIIDNARSDLPAPRDEHTQPLSFATLLDKAIFNILMRNMRDALAQFSDHQPQNTQNADEPDRCE